MDICDSTEKTTRRVNHICAGLRRAIHGDNSNELLLVKHTGDGHLVVYDSVAPLAGVAQRLLAYQTEEGESLDFDIRVTLDAGPTEPTLELKDRIGLAINRASRIEKVQIGDLVEKGKKADQLKARNRCIVSHELKSQLSRRIQRRCIYLGQFHIKGFGDQTHSVYQYNVRS